MVNSSSDRKLVESLLAGDEAAFETIRGYIRAIVSGWRGKLGPETQEAEDEILFKVYTDLQDGKFRFAAALKTWIFRIATNTCSNHARYRNRFSNLEPEALSDALGASANPGHDPERLLEIKQEAALWARILSQLSAECRELIRLHIYCALKYSECAKKMHKDEGTLRWRMNNCKEAAREIYLRITTGGQRFKDFPV